MNYKQLKKIIRSLLHFGRCFSTRYKHFFILSKPTSRLFGYDRGMPIDRYYIENFLSENAQDISGDVLEIAEDTYSRKFGGANIRNMHILHVNNIPEATIVGNFETGEGIPENAFDCMILTQTLPFIYDCHAAVKHIFRALRPGGVLLATVPGISQISRYDMDCWGDYWRFTDCSARKVFEDFFGKNNVKVNIYGNVYASASFLYGYAVQDVAKKKLDLKDNDYQMIIGIRAVKK